MQERIQNTAVKRIETVEPQYPEKGGEDGRGSGHSKKHRGNHRSHTRGVGALDLFRKFGVLLRYKR